MPVTKKERNLFLRDVSYHGEIQANLGPDDIKALLPRHTSIYSFQYQLLVMSTTDYHRSQVSSYLRDYERGASICDIATRVNFSPCLLARMLLAAKFSLPPKSKQLGWYLKDPSSLADVRFREELKMCAKTDAHFSHEGNLAKQQSGGRYERVLEERLSALGVAFYTEDDLRVKGVARTPDVLLPVPITVHGRLVNWIDSKAMFGDNITHKKNLKQFAGYINRFGPGLVIYWFDHLEGLPGSLVLNTNADSKTANECVPGLPGLLVLPGFPDAAEIQTIASTLHDSLDAEVGLGPGLTLGSGSGGAPAEGATGTDTNPELKPGDRDPSCDYDLQALFATSFPFSRPSPAGFEESLERQIATMLRVIGQTALIESAGSAGTGTDSLRCRTLE